MKGHLNRASQSFYSTVHSQSTTTDSLDIPCYGPPASAPPRNRTTQLWTIFDTCCTVELLRGLLLVGKKINITKIKQIRKKCKKLKNQTTRSTLQSPSISARFSQVDLSLSFSLFIYHLSSIYTLCVALQARYGKENKNKIAYSPCTCVKMAYSVVCAVLRDQQEHLAPFGGLWLGGGGSWGVLGRTLTTLAQTAHVAPCTRGIVLEESSCQRQDWAWFIGVVSGWRQGGEWEGATGGAAVAPSRIRPLLAAN